MRRRTSVLLGSQPAGLKTRRYWELRRVAGLAVLPPGVPMRGGEPPWNVATIINRLPGWPPTKTRPRAKPDAWQKASEAVHDATRRGGGARAAARAPRRMRLQ